MTVATMRKFEKSINGNEVTLDLDGTPREIDETLCRLWILEDEASDSAEYAKRSLWYKYTKSVYAKNPEGPQVEVRVKSNCSVRYGVWLDEIPSEDLVQTWSQLLELTDASDVQTLQRMDEFNEDAEKCRKLEVEIDSEYQVRRWSRFFLVTSSSGHIHSSMSCSTCHKGENRTTFALLASLSGQDEKAAVDKLGPALCSVCFPSAPVEFVENAVVDKKLAETLRQKGPEAFEEALREAKARALTRAANACQRSGKKPLKEGRKTWSRGVENAWCDNCERWCRVTKAGVFAKHQKAKR